MNFKINANQMRLFILVGEQAITGSEYYAAIGGD